MWSRVDTADGSDPLRWLYSVKFKNVSFLIVSGSSKENDVAPALPDWFDW
jgi:hypothetical protein